MRTKNAVKRTPAWPPIRELYAAAWAGAHRLGYSRVPPPHAYKQREVKRYAKQAKIRTLVETGTYMGDMIDATKHSFDVIYSVELDDAYHQTAVRMFAELAHVVLRKGDSSTVIPALVQEIDEPALFWLDAHYSSGRTARGEENSPILKELVPILTAEQRGHIVLIDDAREFLGLDGYPTITRLGDIVSDYRPDLVMTIDADVIRILPR